MMVGIMGGAHAFLRPFGSEGGRGQDSWLEPESWFLGASQTGSFKRSPAPASADMDLEQMYNIQLKLPAIMVHAFIITRLMTSILWKWALNAGAVHFEVPAS
jgi:hypothetical protein